MSLVAQAYLFTSETDIQQLMSVAGELARLDDNADGMVGDGSAGYLQAANYATSRAKFYLQQHYDEADLATSWLVNEWTTIIATHWICSRRGNPIPEVIQSLMFGDGTTNNRGCMGDMSDVRAKRAYIPDIAPRHLSRPSWSTLTLDGRYRLMQLRVQRPVSDQTPVSYPQRIDMGATYAGEY